LRPRRPHLPLRFPLPLGQPEERTIRFRPLMEARAQPDLRVQQTGQPARAGFACFMRPARILLASVVVAGTSPGGLISGNREEGRPGTGQFVCRRAGSRAAQVGRRASGRSRRACCLHWPRPHTRWAADLPVAVRVHIQASGQAVGSAARRGRRVENALPAQTRSAAPRCDRQNCRSSFAEWPSAGAATSRSQARAGGRAYALAAAWSFTGAVALRKRGQDRRQAWGQAERT